jgi:hypothetical protein
MQADIESEAQTGTTYWHSACAFCVQNCCTVSAAVVPASATQYPAA